MFKIHFKAPNSATRDSCHTKPSAGSKGPGNVQGGFPAIATDAGVGPELEQRAHAVGIVGPGSQVQSSVAVCRVDLVQGSVAVCRVDLVQVGLMRREQADSGGTARAINGVQPQMSAWFTSAPASGNTALGAGHAQRWLVSESRCPPIDVGAPIQSSHRIVKPIEAISALECIMMHRRPRVKVILVWATRLSVLAMTASRVHARTQCTTAGALLMYVMLSSGPRYPARVPTALVTQLGWVL